MNASQNVDAVPIPAEIREQKRKKKFLRKEAKHFESNRTFAKQFNEKALFSYMLELVTKAGNLLSCVSALGRPADSMKVLEMSLNKPDILLDKSKMLILRMENIYVIVPFTITKIEVRTRNVVINMRPKFEAIQRFTAIYLEQYAMQVKLEKKVEAAWIEEQKKKEASGGMQNAKKSKK